MHTTRFVGAVAALALLATSCGGESDTATTSATESSATIQSGAAPADADASTSETSTATESSEATLVVESTIPPTVAPTTTLPPGPDPFDLASLPALITAADAAIGGAAVDPFIVVDDIVGFPLPIPVPDGSTLQEFNATLSSVGEDGTTGWDARYVVAAPGGSVDDIDIALDDNGPGSVQLIDFFDPIFADLGFERKNSTASDPGDPGGPHSVNHVYVAVDPQRSINGVPATLDPIFISSSEDINGWAYRDDRPELGGYTVDVGFDTVTPTDGDTTATPTPFPVANAVIESFPLPDGLTLSDLSIGMWARSADSFSIDKGPTYLDLVITWEAAPDVLDEIVAFYADPPATFTDESIVMAGQANTFDEGAITRTEPFEYDGTDVHLFLLWLERYGARLSITASDDGVEPVEVQLDIELNPNDLQLAFPTE